jgi:DNA-binding winged helix-turn-helix (wHTH) protein/TolB-like protein
MAPNSRQIYEFGPFVLDPAERRLTRDGAPVPLTPKVFDLLALLVERRGRLLDKDVLLKALWPDSFVEEGNLTVNVSSLRRALGEPASGGEFIETVPRRGYRFVGAVTERRAEDFSPPALPAPVEPESILPVHHRLPRKALAAAGIGILLMGTAIWMKWSPGDRAPRRVGAAADIRSLAILPFLPLEGAGDADSLGLGMADALITKLSNLQQISIRPTSSVLSYAKATRDALAAGRELGVDGLLEGHIQRSGTSIRVTVQLLSVREGAPLWADRFDDELSNLFQVQDSISERMAIALSLTLTGSERQQLTKRFTLNTGAYEDFQLGQFYLLRGSLDAATKAIDYFRQAVAKDPAYAAAYAGMATARITTAGASRPDDYREAAQFADEALRLDPDLPEAHQAVGWVAMYSRWDWPVAEQSFRRAIQLNRTAPIPHLALSTVMSARGRHAEAIREMQLANQLDPASVMITRNVAWTYTQARQNEQAEMWCRKAIDMNPSDSVAYRELGRVLLREKRYSEAIAALEKASTLGADMRIELARAHTLAGHPDAARRAYDEDAPAPAHTFELVLLHISRGQRDLVFDLLDRAVQERNSRVPWIGIDPDLDAVRSDTRFARLLRLVHLDDVAVRQVDSR